MHGATAIRAGHQLIHTHYSYTSDFAPSEPSPPRAISRFYGPRQPHTAKLNAPRPTGCDGQPKSELFTSFCYPFRQRTNQGIQTSLAASNSAEEREIPMSCKHVSLRLSSALREREYCHHIVSRRFTSLQQIPWRG